MQELYLPTQKASLKSNFEQELEHLNSNIKPYSTALGFEEKILYVFFHKFNQISKSILCLGETSELSSLILARSLWEIVIDTCYLVLKNDLSLWKRYFAFGDLDRIKLKLISSKILLEHGLLEDALTEIDLIETLLQKKYVYTTGEMRTEGEIILLSILKPEKYQDVVSSFQEIKNSNGQILTPDTLINGINSVLEKIKISSWRPNNPGVDKLFYEIYQELESELKNNQISVSSLESYHCMLYGVGNAATHSSDTLAYLSYDHSSESFSQELETKTDAVYSLALFMSQVMTWALNKADMLVKDKVA